MTTHLKYSAFSTPAGGKITLVDKRHANGADLNIGYGISPTPFGDCLVAHNLHGICHLTLASGDIESAINELYAAWPLALLERDDSYAKNLIKEVLEDPSSIRLHLQATPFQLAIWKALLNIPHGTTVSYQKLAAAAGHPAAIRAAGTAIGKNPIALLIPCHRVIRNDGSIGGYRWGIERKRAILNWEATHTLQ